MPVISMFYGIVITMLFFDNKQHNMPHIHVKYQGDKAAFSVIDGALLAGKLLQSKLNWFKPGLKSIEMNCLLTGTSPSLEREFSNGGSRFFEMKPYLDQGIFRELQDQKYFQKIKLGQGTVTWPHEQDMSTIRLYLEGK